MIRRQLFILLTMLTCVTSIVAQVSFDVSVVEKRRIVTGTQDFQKSDDVIFANALLWAVNEGPGRKEEIVDCDFVKRQFSMVYHLQREGEEAYTCRLGVKVAQGKLVFLVSEVKVQGGLLSSFVSFDRLNPEKKAKHQDIINDFQALNNQKLLSLFSFVGDYSPKITNWKNVCMNRIDRGMSADEVRLIYGKPINIQSDGTKVQYMYSSFVYVFMENDTVASFVN